MADYYHRPESAPAKAKYPLTRQLTILETACQSAVKVRGVGINYVPVNLEPCIILQGKWLRRAGFLVGEKVTVTVNQGQLAVTLNPALSAFDS